MLLTLSERFALLGVLPQQGDFATLRIVRKLRESLSLNEQEYKEFDVHSAGQTMADGMIVPEGRIAWNAKGQEPREIPIGEKATDVIAEALKALDKAKALTEQHIDLYDKFVK